MGNAQLSHAPLPWVAVNYENEAGWTIDHAGDGSVACDLSEEDARRIVACVNACGDIPADLLRERIITRPPETTLRNQ